MDGNEKKVHTQVADLWTHFKKFNLSGLQNSSYLPGTWGWTCPSRWQNCHSWPTPSPPAPAAFVLVLSPDWYVCGNLHPKGHLQKENHHQHVKDVSQDERLRTRARLELEFQTEAGLRTLNSFKTSNILNHQLASILKGSNKIKG